MLIDTRIYIWSDTGLALIWGFEGKLIFSFVFYTLKGPSLRLLSNDRTVAIYELSSNLFLQKSFDNQKWVKKYVVKQSVARLR